MYYVKSKLKGAEIKINIDDENVYTRCVICGKEIKIDIVDEIKCFTDFDLYGTGRICSQECSDSFNATRHKGDSIPNRTLLYLAGKKE